MDITIGPDGETAIQRITKSGYAADPEEVVRLAVLAYERMLEDGGILEDESLIARLGSADAHEIRDGKVPAFTLDEIKELLED